METAKRLLSNLRKQGLSAVEKRAGRDASEGLVQAYIHQGSRLGVLLEVNCETDFVARTDDFQEFAKDVAMHIAASQPLAVDREGIPADAVERERVIYLEQAKNEGKPEHIAEKIVEGPHGEVLSGKLPDRTGLRQKSRPDHWRINHRDNRQNRRKNYRAAL